MASKVYKDVVRIISINADSTESIYFIVKFIVVFNTVQIRLYTQTALISGRWINEWMHIKHLSLLPESSLIQNRVSGVLVWICVSA